MVLREEAGEVHPRGNPENPPGGYCRAFPKLSSRCSSHDTATGSSTEATFVGITGDSADADQFIDAGNGYDVTLALRNIFEIGAFGTANYTTHTIFGVEAPDDVEEPNPVPEPATVLGGAALAALAAVRGIRRKK